MFQINKKFLAIILIVVVPVIMIIMTITQFNKNKPSSNANIIENTENLGDNVNIEKIEVFISNKDDIKIFLEKEGLHSEYIDTFMEYMEESVLPVIDKRISVSFDMDTIRDNKTGEFFLIDCIDNETNKYLTTGFIAKDFIYVGAEKINDR